MLIVIIVKWSTKPFHICSFWILFFSLNFCYFFWLLLQITWYWRQRIPLSGASFNFESLWSMSFHTTLRFFSFNVILYRFTSFVGNPYFLLIDCILLSYFLHIHLISSFPFVGRHNFNVNRRYGHSCIFTLFCLLIFFNIFLNSYKLLFIDLFLEVKFNKNSYRKVWWFPVNIFIVWFSKY